MCLPQIFDEAGVDLVLSGAVQGQSGSCEMSLIEEGELVEESLQVVVFEEGVDLFIEFRNCGKGYK